jgi:hypothetical protein
VTSSLTILTSISGSDRGTISGLLCVRETDGGDPDAPGRFVVRLGRVGPSREVRCRGVLGSRVLAAADIRPVPEALRERMEGEQPWAGGITGQGLCPW